MPHQILVQIDINSSLRYNIVYYPSRLIVKSVGVSKGSCYTKDNKTKVFPHYLPQKCSKHEKGKKCIENQFEVLESRSIYEVESFFKSIFMLKLVKHFYARVFKRLANIGL